MVSGTADNSGGKKMFTHLCLLFYLLNPHKPCVYIRIPQKSLSQLGCGQAAQVGDRHMGPKKKVVLAVAAGHQPEWTSRLEWEKYNQISILNANIIIIRLLYQNVFPRRKT